MKTILAPRASAILYDVLRNVGRRLPFLLPANICPIVPMTFLKAGTPFELVDLSPMSLQMDMGIVVKGLESNVRTYGGILYSHTYGEPATPTEFFEWVKDRWPDLILIDDRCLCAPDLEPTAGSAADVVLYSTSYAKIVDVGFGGFAHLRDDLAYKHHALRFEEAELKAVESNCRECVEAGRRFEYRDSAWLQTDASLPEWKVYADSVRQVLPNTIAHRGEINAVYNSLIPDELQLGKDFQLWRFNLSLPNKDVVLKAIFDSGLFASSHYRSLVGVMGEGTDVHARSLANRVVNLFNDHHYTLDMAERTARIILQNL